jgi:hypothetical protein
LTSGPLEEKARAETTAMTIPVVRADEAVRTPAVLGFECGLSRLNSEYTVTLALAEVRVIVVHP